MRLDEKTMSECVECSTILERRQSTLRRHQYLRYLFLDWLYERHINSVHLADDTYRRM